MPARRESKPETLLTVQQAAELLGVSAPTLRRWDATGQFKARRHPINGYRQYRVREVMRLRRRIEAGVAA